MKNKHKTKFMRTVMLLLACVFTFATAWAETDGDYEYSINSDGVTVTITIYNGSGGDLTIPASLDEKSVTAIDGNAFNNEYGKKVTTLTIPATVTAIGINAFANCSSLKSVTFYAGTSPISIGNAAFAFCSSLESVTFERDVTAINILGFANCSSLKSVTFEGEVGSIGENVFLYCTSLKSICMLSETGTAPNLRNAGIPQGCTIYVRGSQYNYTNQKHLYTINPGTNVTVCSTPIVTSSIGTKYYAEGAKVRLDYSGKFSKTGYGPAYKATKTVGGTDVTADVIRESVIDMPAYDVTVTASGVDVWGVDKGADGSQQKPYVITSTIGLDLLAKNVNGTNGNAMPNIQYPYFVLDADIEYSHETAWNDDTSEENNYTPIGNVGSRIFKGTFNGQGHVVSGIRIHNSADTEYIGLFGNIYRASVSHVVLKDARIWGCSNIGGILGNGHTGNITDCHVTEDVCISIKVPDNNEDIERIGGIVGEISSSSIVSGCTSKAKIKAPQGIGKYIGGIVGLSSGGSTIKDCLYLGGKIIEGNSYVGAIVGLANHTNHNGSVFNCYYTDKNFTGKDKNGNDITLSSNGNPAIGYNNGATVTNTGLAHAITLGNGVTLSGTATGYALDGEAIRLTSYATNDVGHALKLETVSGNTTTTAYYSAQGNEVTFDYVGTIPAGYSPSYSVTDNDGNSVSNTNTFTMPDKNVIANVTLEHDNWGIAGGANGSKEKPYVITTTEDLDLLAKKVNGTDGYTANDYSGKYFVLGADIEYPQQTTWDDVNSTENNYTPIGTVYDNYLYRYFKGNFDGCGYAVKGIRIYKTFIGYYGLFGLVGEGGTVKHVTVSESRITGKGHVSGIVALNRGGIVTDCHTTPETSFDANSTNAADMNGHAGGITSYNAGTISGCTSDSHIKGTYLVGGIVGTNTEGIIQDCIYFGGQISGLFGVGAVTGENDKGTVTNCYYTDGSFTGIDINKNKVTLENGNPAIGENYDVNTLTRKEGKGTYSNTGLAHAITLGNGVTLSGTANAYALVGEAIRLTSYTNGTNNYALKLETVSGSTTTTTYYSAQGNDVALNYTGTIPNEYVAKYSANNTYDGSDVTSSAIKGSTLTMPTFDVTANVTVTHVWGIDNGADGSEQNPYFITTTDGLDLLAKKVNGTDGYHYDRFTGKYFVLGADIEYQHQTAWDDVNSTENNYTPIGTMFKIDNYSLYRYFEGTFDGCGHTVKGIRIYNTSKGCYGLFGSVKRGGTVKHVTVSDIRITNADEYGSIGGIAGESYGSIIDCHVTSDVSLNKQTNTNGTLCGGITGYNDGGTVSGCTSAAIVKGGIYVGGIVGSNQKSNGILKDCIYLGNEVSGNSCVGAVAGDNDGSTIINCYYTDGSITGKDLNGNDVTLANGQPVIGENYDVNTAQGSRKGTYSNTGLAHAITLGNGVTLSGTANAYALDGAAIGITSYTDGTNDYALKLETVSGSTTTTTYYSAQGNEVALNYSGNTPAGTTFGYIVKDTDGGLVSVTNTNPNTFTMPGKDVNAYAGFYMENVPYIAADGSSTSTPDGVKVWVIDGTESTLGYENEDTWYLSNTAATANNGNGLSIDNGILMNGDVNLILADNSKMTVTENTQGSSAIYSNIKSNKTLDIYGQTTGNGKLTAIGNVCAIFVDKDLTINGGEVKATGGIYGINSNGDITIRNSKVIADGSILGITSEYLTLIGSEIKSTATTVAGIETKETMTINGGKVTAESKQFGLNSSNGITINGGEVNAIGNTVRGINSSQGDLTINGGKVTAEGSMQGISVGGGINLGWTNADDFIKASSYEVSAGKDVTMASGKIFQYTDGSGTSKIYEGVITTLATGGTLNNLKLTPYGYGGYCGKGNDVKSITWEIPFDSEGKLSTEMAIDGSGEMTDYDMNGAPWNKYGFTIANIVYPVTSIGKNAFKGCQNLKVILVADESAYYNINWTDSERKFLAPKEIVINKNESGWGTYCHNFPISYSLNEGKAIDVTGLSADGKSVVITEVADNYVAPLTPLLLNYTPPTHTRQVYDNFVILTAIPATATTIGTTPDIVDNGGTDIVFYGNPKQEALSATKAANYIYIIGNTEGKQSYVLHNGCFLKADENQGIAANRCWMNITGTNNARVLSIIGEDDETDGIDDNVNVNHNDDAWYDLNGRKIANGQKPTKSGIYINNGKKVVVK